MFPLDNSGGHLAESSMADIGGLKGNGYVERGRTRTIQNIEAFNSVLC